MLMRMYMLCSPTEGGGGGEADGGGADAAADAEADGAAEAEAEGGGESLDTAAADAAAALSEVEALLTGELDGEEINSEHKGLNYQEILAGLPPDARKLLGNLRASYSKKTGALAEERRELARLRQEIDANRKLMLQGEGAKAIKLAAESDPTKVEGFDPWSQEGIEQLAEQKAAKMLQKYLSGMQEEFQVGQYRQQLETFKTEHPDLMGDAEVKEQVTAAMRANPDLRLEAAYWQVKGKLGHRRAQAAKEAAEQDRLRNRETLRTTKLGRARGGKQPVFKNAWEAFQAAQAAEADNGLD